jgi:serine-type D-Ala-D-Ala carboxypeptidase (penicillin-binding protein 5/6)
MLYKESMMRLLAIVLLFFPLCVSANDTITASSYILVEKNSFQVISGKDYHKRLAPASTTKVMTTIVALERLNGYEIVTADSNVLSIPASKLSLLPGREYKAIDLIKGTMVQSANDAAYALAVHVGGDETSFAGMMNKKNQEIGAYNTHFKNASGLTVDNQYTTAYDLALIMRHALSSERFKEIAATKYFLFQEGTKNIRYKNHNRFLFCFEPAIAGKTGFTRMSRHCYVGAFEKDEKVYILALLGSNNLWGDAVNILKNLYEQLPSDREIRLAKSCPVKLVSYKEKKEKKPVAKKKAKKSKSAKKNKTKA